MYSCVANNINTMSTFVSYLFKSYYESIIASNEIHWLFIIGVFNHLDIYVYKAS